MHEVSANKADRWVGKHRYTSRGGAVADISGWFCSVGWHFFGGLSGLDPTLVTGAWGGVSGLQAIFAEGSMHGASLSRMWSEIEAAGARVVSAFR